MKLASLSTPIRHRSQPQGLASGTGSSAFHFHTVVWQADGFGFDATSGEFFTASPTALIVMQALGEGMTRLQILDRLTACFEVARGTAERDLESFLAELVHMGLAKEMN